MPTSLTNVVSWFLVAYTVWIYSATVVMGQYCGRCDEGSSLRSVAEQGEIAVAGNSLVYDRYAMWTGKMHVNLDPHTGEMAVFDFDQRHFWGTGPDPEGSLKKSYEAVMQGDGNLVIYSNALVSEPFRMSPTNVDRRPVWSSVLKQQGQGPYCFLLRKDGELEILDSTCSSMWTAGSAILDRPSNPDGSCKTYTTTLGDTCDIVAESYGLNLAAFLRYNKDTNCAAGLATGSVVCLTVGTMPSLAPSLKVKEPYVIWVRALSGTVLEINDGKVVVAKSRPTFAMQEWRLEPVAIGKPGQYRLIDMETAHCIYESQMNIVAGECRPSLQAKAEFYVVYVMEDNPSTSSTYLRHVASGKCLEVVFSESIASLALGECKMGVSPSQVFGLTTASSLRTTCISHVVIQGDDCESVSALYNTSSSSLEYFNRISCGGPLRVGQHLCVTEGTYPSSKLKKDPSKEACDGRQVSSNLGTCIDMAEECGISFGSFTLLNRDVVDCSKPLSSNAIQSVCCTEGYNLNLTALAVYNINGTGMCVDGAPSQDKQSLKVTASSCNKANFLVQFQKVGGTAIGSIGQLRSPSSNLCMEHLSDKSVLWNNCEYGRLTQHWIQFPLNATGRSSLQLATRSNPTQCMSLRGLRISAGERDPRTWNEIIVDECRHSLNLKYLPPPQAFSMAKEKQFDESNVSFVILNVTVSDVPIRQNTTYKVEPPPLGTCASLSSNFTENRAHFWGFSASESKSFFGSLPFNLNGSFFDPSYDFRLASTIQFEDAGNGLRQLLFGSRCIEIADGTVQLGSCLPRNDTHFSSQAFNISCQTNHLGTLPTKFSRCGIQVAAQQSYTCLSFDSQANEDGYYPIIRSSEIFDPLSGGCSTSFLLRPLGANCFTPLKRDKAFLPPEKLECPTILDRSATPLNSTLELPCPLNLPGVQKVYCKETGFWDNPDISSCDLPTCLPNGPFPGLRAGQSVHAPCPPGWQATGEELGQFGFCNALGTLEIDSQDCYKDGLIAGQLADDVGLCITFPETQNLNPTFTPCNGAVPAQIIYVHAAGNSSLVLANSDQTLCLAAFGFGPVHAVRCMTPSNIPTSAMWKFASNEQGCITLLNEGRCLSAYSSLPINSTMFNIALVECSSSNYRNATICPLGRSSLID